MAVRLSIILLFLLPVIAQAQLKSEFIGICTFDDFTNTTGDNYRGDILNFIDRYNIGVTTKNIQVGDEIIDGSGDVFEILTVHSTASNFEADITVQARFSASGAPIGSGQVYRPTINGIVPPGSIDNLGLSNVTKGLIDMHNALRLDSLLGTVANGDSIIAVGFANDSLSITMESDTVYTAIIPVDSLHQLQADSIAALYDSLGVKVDTIIAGNNINITSANGQYTISAPDPNVGTDDQTAGEVWYNDIYLPLDVNDVQQAIDSLKRDLDAVSAGPSDGVATSGTLDVGNEEIDVTVAAPGSAFSIDLSAIETLGSFSGWDTDVSDDFDGAWSSLTGVPAGFADNVDDVNDADASSTNELQDITWNESARQLTLSDGGGTVIITDDVDDADADATNELQDLTWNDAARQLTLSDGGGTVIITDDVDDADADATNELQDLTWNDAARQLTLSDGGGTVIITDDVDDSDSDATNEGSLTVAAGTGSTAIINSNTSGSTGVTIEAQAGIGITENTGTGTIFIENTGDLSATNEIDIIGFSGDVGSAQQIGDGEFLDLEGGFGVVTTMSTDKANFKVDTMQVATVYSVGDTIANLTSGVTDFEELAFNTAEEPTLSPGMIGWNSDESTVDIALDSDVTLQVGQEMVYYVKNQTGSTINDGQVVQFSGSLGASGRLLIALARADTTSEAKYIMGIATEEIANGADGFVTAFGKIPSIDTDGSVCSETWNDGDILYLSATTAGCLTKTPPTEPSLRIPVAAVVHAANSGTLFVRPTYYPKMDDLHDVTTDGATNGQVLVYNSSSGVWEPGAISDATPLASNGLSVNAETVELGGNLTQNTVIQGQDLYDLTFSTIDVLLANTRRTTINNYENFRASVPLFSESINLEFKLVEADTLAYINGQFTVDELGRFRPGPSTIATNPPNTGYIGYNSTTGNLEQWDGSTWSAIGSSGGSAFWEDASGTVRTVSSSAGLDLVFGSSSTEDTGTSTEDARFFFDNSKAALYANEYQGTQADDTNRGFNSVNFTRNAITSGYTSASIGGESNDINGNGSVAVACKDCISDGSSEYSVLTGKDARSTLENDYVHGGGGDFQLGHHQYRRLIAWKDHIGTGDAVLHLDGTNADLVIPNNTMWAGQCECSAIVKTAGTGTNVGDHKFYQGRFVGKNISGSTTVAWINTSDASMSSSSFSSSSLALTSDDVNDAITVIINSIPGSVSSSTHITCTLHITETGY